MDWSVPVALLLVELDGANCTRDGLVADILRRQGMVCVRRMGLHRLNTLWVDPSRFASTPDGPGRSSCDGFGPRARPKNCPALTDLPRRDLPPRPRKAFRTG